MSTPRRAVHRDSRAGGAWLAYVRLSQAEGGRHRRMPTTTERAGTSALLRRAVAVAAAWLAAFGVFSMAEGWTPVGATALVIGIFIALGVAAGHVIATPAELAREPVVPRPRGLNVRPNGYDGHTT